jgi:HEPN domain-containing protein
MIARVPPELLDPVVAYFNPRRVILFGSRARDEARPDSDIDLLVVMDDDVPPEKLTLRAGMEARRDYHQPADVIPVREEMFRRTGGIPGTLSRAAVLDGVTVYEKAPPVIAEPDSADVRNSVLGWLRVARSDMQVARACLDMRPPQQAVAAYHCQQAAEKVLKGFLVLAGIDFRRTHDLDPLGRSVVAAFPAEEPLVRPLRAWTDWGVAYRYLDAPVSAPEPTAHDLTEALQQVARLADALEAKLRVDGTSR